MLLWETLGASGNAHAIKRADGVVAAPRALRLPYDTRCTSLTKAGMRCRGRIRQGKEVCPFHDPELAAARRRQTTKGQAHRRRLSHLRDGYLRKLNNVAAVGNAMDRLYREVRLGLVTTEMGRVLFGILTRLFDSGLAVAGPCPHRSKAARLRPKLDDMLTRRERLAWKKAVKRAPSRTGNGIAQESDRDRQPTAPRLQVAS